MNTRERIAALPVWSAPPDLTPLEGGRTNDNYVATDAGQRYFVRVGEDLPYHRVTRAAERAAHRHAAALGLAPPIRHAQEDVLVTEFVDGDVWSSAEEVTGERLRALAAVFARLHGAAPPAGVPVFDPAGVCRHYLDLLDVDHLPAETRSTIEALLHDCPPGSPRCLIHADPIAENVIETRERLWLVDWEYAGLGEPETDLAMIAANFELDAQQLGILVGAHGAADPDRVRALRPVVAAREALWCLVELQVNGPRGDLESYARTCLARVGVGT